MKMTSGETKPSVGSRSLRSGVFIHPADVLQLFRSDHLPDFRIAGMMAISTAHRFGWRHRRKNRRHPFTIGKTHVKIPLIFNRKGLNAVRNGMCSVRFEVSNPMRVHRIIHFKSTADARNQTVVRFTRLHLHCVMNRT